MRFRAVLFDLDGTLLDTLADIAQAANCVLAALEFPTHPTAAYGSFIGDGVGMLFRRALPADQCREDLVTECIQRFPEEYARCWNDLSRPYDGIAEVLDALVRRSISLTVLSNKPHEFTRRCVDEYFSRWPFRVALGQRDGVPRKPDPAGAIEIAKLLDLPTDDFVYAGDSNVDMHTARAAGMYAVGVTWGFRSADELRAAGAQDLIDRPMELLSVMGDA